MSFGGIFGSEQKCHSVFTEMYPRLCMYAFRMLKDMQESEDVVQDVFVSLMTSSSKLTNEDVVRSYLYRAVNNACLNHIRHKNYVRTRIEAYVEEGGVQDDDQLLNTIETEVMERIFAQIDELPAECRKVFELSYIHGYDVAKVAEKLNVSVNTVKTQRLRARKFLQSRLKNLFVIALLIFRL